MAQQNINMTREELKRLWLSIPTDPNKKQENTIVVAIGLSSCGSGGYCMQSEWVTPLSKQYSKR